MAKATLASKSMLAKMAVLAASTTTVAVQGAALQKAHDASLDAVNYTSEKVANHKEESSILPSEQAYYDFINKVNSQPEAYADEISVVDEEDVVQPITNVITEDNLAHGSPQTKVSNLKVINNKINVEESRPKVNDEVIDKFFNEMQKTVEDAKKRVESRSVNNEVEQESFKEETDEIITQQPQQEIRLADDSQVEETQPEVNSSEENVIENVEENQSTLSLAEENVIENVEDSENNVNENYDQSEASEEQIDEIVSVDEEEHVAVGVAVNESNESQHNQQINSENEDTVVSKTYTRVVKFVDENNQQLAKDEVQSFTINGIKHKDGTYTWSQPASSIKFNKVVAPSIDGYGLDSNNTFDLTANDSDESVEYTQYCTYHKESEFRNMKIEVVNTSGEVIASRDNTLVPLDKNVMIAFMSDSLPGNYVFEKMPVVNISKEKADQSNNSIKLLAKSIDELSTTRVANISAHFVNQRSVEFSQGNIPVQVKTYHNPVTDKTIVLENVQITGKMINDLNIPGVNYKDSDVVFDLRASDFNQNLQTNIFIMTAQKSHEMHENQEFGSIESLENQFKEEFDSITPNDSFKEEFETVTSEPSEENNTNQENHIEEESYTNVSKTFTRTIKFIDDDANGSQIKPSVTQEITINGERNTKTGAETYRSGHFDEVQTNLEGYVNKDNVKAPARIVDANYNSEVIEIHYSHQKVRTPQQVQISESFVDENGNQLSQQRQVMIQVTGTKDVITGQISISDNDINNGMNSYLQSNTPDNFENYQFISSKADSQNRTIVHKYETQYDEEEEEIITPTTPTTPTNPDEEFGEEEETITTPTTPEEEFGEEEETIVTPTNPDEEFGEEEEEITTPTTPSNGYKYTDWGQIDRNVIYQSTQKILSEMPTQSSKLEYSQYQSINDILGGKGGDQFNLTGSKNILNASLDYQNRVREVNRRYSQRMINNINKLRSDLSIRQLSLLNVSNQSLNNALINHSIDEYVANTHTTKTDKNMSIINSHANWSAENFMNVHNSASNLYDVSPESIADDFFRLVLKENNAFLSNPNSAEAGHLANILSNSTKYYGSLYVNNITTQKGPGGIFGTKDITMIRNSATDLFFD